MADLVDPNLVFVVDDEETLRRVVTRRLDRNGGRVMAFPSAEPALAAIREHRPGVILSDLRMPGMNGLELLEEVRTQYGKEVPAFVIMTAYGDMDNVKQALRTGAYDYLSKPFELDDLAGTIGRAVERVRLLQMRTLLASVLVEDLLSPLGALEMNLSALASGEAGPVEALQGELLGIMQRETGRMHRLVRNLQDIRLLERDELYRKTEPFALHRALAEGIAGSGQGGLRLSVAPEASAVTLSGDPVLFSRLVDRLVRSSSGAGGEAEIDVARVNGSVELTFGPLPPLPENLATVIGASLHEQVAPKRRRRAKTKRTGSSAGRPGTSDPMRGPSLAARVALRRSGCPLDEELGLSFAVAAAHRMGGGLRIELLGGAARAVVRLPVVETPKGDG